MYWWGFNVSTFEGHPNYSVPSCNKCTVHLSRSPPVLACSLWRQRANVVQCFLGVSELPSALRCLQSEHSWIHHGEFDSSLVQQVFALIKRCPFLGDHLGIIREDHDMMPIPAHLSHLPCRFSDLFPVPEPQKPGEDRSGRLFIRFASGEGPVRTVNFEPPWKVDVQQLWNSVASEG